MKMRSVFYSWILYFIFGITVASYGQKKEIAVEWKKEKIAPGLIWKSAHLDSLFGSAQHMNVLEVNSKKRKLAIIYNP